LVRARRGLEFYRDLPGNELFAGLDRRIFVFEAVLDFGLQIASEAVTDRGIDAPNVVAPLNTLAFLRHSAK